MKTWSLKIIATILVGAAFVLSTACSQRWIEADAGLTSDDLFTQINAVQQAAEGDGNSSAMSLFNDLINSPSSFIYYVDGPSPMGNALSAASLVTFNIVGRPEVSDLDLSNAIVIYVEDFTENGWQSALLVQIDVEGESKPVTEVFESVRPPYVDDDVYYAEMGHGGTHKLTLRSFYTADGELQTVIQFQVFEIINGVEEYIGKFGAMVGYGG